MKTILSFGAVFIFLSLLEAPGFAVPTTGILAVQSCLSRDWSSETFYLMGKDHHGVTQYASLVRDLPRSSAPEDDISSYPFYFLGVRYVVTGRGEISRCIRPAR